MNEAGSRVDDVEDQASRRKGNMAERKVPVIRYEAGRSKGSTRQAVELCNGHGRNDVSGRSGLARWRAV